MKMVRCYNIKVMISHVLVMLVFYYKTQSEMGDNHFYVVARVNMTT